MYSDKDSDKRKRRISWTVTGIVIAVVLVSLALVLPRISGRGVNDEAAASVKAAVERAALQCYVVEGAYPPNLEYLTEKYGLGVNTEAFYIHYDAFASNLPPDIRVEVRKTAETK